MITFDFTYETVTPESAEHGDAADQGFIMPGLWKFDPDQYERQKWNPGDLAGIINFAQSLGIYADEGAINSFYSVDPDINYRTGDHQNYAMHIAGITPATFERIARLLS